MDMQIINRYRNKPIAIESGAAILVILSLLAGWKLGAMQFFTMSGVTVPFYQPYSQIQTRRPYVYQKGVGYACPCDNPLYPCLCCSICDPSNYKNGWLDAPDWERRSESNSLCTECLPCSGMHTGPDGGVDR